MPPVERHHGSVVVGVIAAVFASVGAYVLGLATRGGTENIANWVTGGIVALGFAILFAIQSWSARKTDHMRMDIFRISARIEQNQIDNVDTVLGSIRDHFNQAKTSMDELKDGVGAFVQISQRSPNVRPSNVTTMREARGHD